jgi:hypothetical protein
MNGGSIASAIPKIESSAATVSVVRRSPSNVCCMVASEIPANPLSAQEWPKNEVA